MPSTAKLVRLAHQKRCTCDATGTIECNECGGSVRVVSARSQRQELLRTAAVEAARQYVAAQLRAERIHGNRGITGDEADGLQTLRDCLLGERKAR